MGAVKNALFSLFSQGLRRSRVRPQQESVDTWHSGLSLGLRYDVGYEKRFRKATSLQAGHCSLVIPERTIRAGNVKASA